MNRRRFISAIPLAGMSGVGGCTDLVALGNDDFDIGMSANAFRPREFTVGVGETVVWKNDGSRSHTVTAYDELIPASADYFASGGYGSQSVAHEAWYAEDGGSIAPGERYEHTFTVAGRHEYYCVPHERQDMAGAIIVED